MISLEAITYIQRLLDTRGISDYYLDVFTLPLAPDERHIYSDANRGFYYLLSHDLPAGLLIASETSILRIDSAWAQKGITKIHEFSGQLALHLPSAGALPYVEFIRVIPR